MSRTAAIIAATTVLFAGSAAAAFQASASVGTRASSRAFTVHSVSNTRGQTILVWRMATGGTAMTYPGSDDVVVVEKSKATVFISGQRYSQTIFHNGGLWSRVIRLRFGVTSAQVARALIGGPTRQVLSPLRSLTRTLAKPPPTFTKINDYATNVGGLARNAPFGIQYAGQKVVGLSLANAGILEFSNPWRNASSGKVVTITYSSKPDQLGVEDRRLVINLTDESSGWGRVYAATLKAGGWKSLKVGGLSAVIANEAQLDFRIGRVVGNITTTTPLTLDAWRMVLGALRSP